MSNSRGGFFSLNRLLGRKHKSEKISSNGLSKPSTQMLTRSTTNLEEISPQNKITPLAVAPNAPFEQSFRITVCLPQNQLFVARIGCKTKLSELLDTICLNKLLDPKKFEFRHPTDETQIFDLNLTIGEVGLNEIKMAQKNVKENTAVRYRLNSINQTNRLPIRPHTMSSASPYSSTNSLNSSDSSGTMTNQRMSNGSIPAVPNRKKRVAPRPPSQNSIAEDPELNCTEVVHFQQNHNDVNAEPGMRNNLARQNFHVSSPNLTIDNNAMQKSNSNRQSHAETSIRSSFDRKQSEDYLNNNKRTSPHRPLSVQYNGTTYEDYEYNATCRNHSRSSSETSDIIGNSSFPEPQPRKRPPIGKKKAPAPPPRTVSNGPIATPRCTLQKLNEEEINDENLIGTIKAKNQPSSDVESTKPLKNPINVSKVMLNVNETAILPTDDEINLSTEVEVKTEERAIDIGNVSKMQNNHLATDENALKQNVTKSKGKKVSVVDLNHSVVEHTYRQSKIDQDDISKQINEIIEQAIEIKEAKLNAENTHHDETIEQNNEINNNNNEGVYNHATAKDENSNYNQYQCEITKLKLENHNTDDQCPKNDPKEVPIQPILNETRSFDFQAYSDNSLPTSTTSTMNTTETPSTGPESLITSDIEDGYKGNELEKKRKVEITREDSKEDFIESQFEFLSEHLDSKTTIDSDEEKSSNFIKKSEIVSSTMIADKCDDTSRGSSSLDKTNVINELTHIINCKHFETFIKPNNLSKNSVDLSKQSSLSNFQIGAYSNSNYESINSSKDYAEKSDEPILERNEEAAQKSISNEKMSTSSFGNGIDDNQKHAETFILPKQISRSLSFHSTFASFVQHDDNAKNPTVGSILSATPRSNSHLSLNRISKYEKRDNKVKTNLMALSRPKSSSELSIADTPSLQSIEVMKSILSSSLTLHPENNNNNNNNSTTTDQESKCKSGDNKFELDNSNQRKPQRHKEDVLNANTNNPNSTNQQKAWKYQGPPAINFSTWGERPKSMVHIKSDNDYIFGGTSKIAALQKRFGGGQEENRNNGPYSDRFASKKADEHCDRISCKLPIVRSVEYKKKVVKNTKSESMEDTPDSIQEVDSFRSNYEISRIVSEKPFSEKMSVSNAKTMTNSPTDSNHGSDIVQVKSFQNFNSKVESVQRMQSFNGHNKIQSANQIEAAKQNNVQKLKSILNSAHKTDTHKDTSEKPIFVQFALRKTGLKEKILVEGNSTNSANDKKGASIELRTNIVKASPIPTAPKPPPILKKPTIRPSPKVQSDPRDQLLDSIRNFKRDTLKQNILY